MTGNTEDSTVMGGYKFKLEKYVEGSSGAAGTWTPITKATKNGVDNAGTDLNLTTSAVDGTIVVSDLSAGVYRFTEETSTGKYGYIVDGTTHYIFKVKGKNIEEITDEAEKLNILRQDIPTFLMPRMQPEIRLMSTTTALMLRRR